MNRSEARCAARRHQVAQLYLAGKVQHEIADDMGVTQQQISLDMKRVMRTWENRMVEFVTRQKAIAAAQIEWAMREAAGSWERSKEPREITETEAIQGGEAAPRHKAKRRLEGSVGNPAFLSAYQKGIDQMATLLGLNAPQKVAPTSPDGEDAWEGTQGLAILLAGVEQAGLVPRLVSSNANNEGA
jgi:hypothetical protein